MYIIYVYTHTYIRRERKYTKKSLLAICFVGLEVKYNFLFVSVLFIYRKYTFELQFLYCKVNYFKNIYFIYYFFGCIGSSLWHTGFSLVVACGFAFSSCGVWAPERVGSVVCGTWALPLRRASSAVVARGLSCPAACGILVP